VKDDYDIFYSRSFLGRAPKERKEYEIDFIVAEKPKQRGKCSAIFCLEVKGGIIEYNGEKREWLQNGKSLAKGPDKQASSATHSLVKRYPDLAREVPIGWALCFPDCELPDNTPLPPNLDYNKILDRKSTIYIDRALEMMVENLKESSNRDGCNIHVYEAFKKELLRNVGFIETLSTQFRYEDKRFIEMTNEQIALFCHFSSNNKILINGYAGTGKTLVAIAAAHEKLSEDKTVLFLCYNRTLANKIRYRFNKYDDRIYVTTFHSVARQIIDELDKTWWKTNFNDDDEFWSLTIPLKLDSVLNDDIKKYDTIIIDEGQDFKEFWFETIFKMANKNSHKIIFADKMQNIFKRDGIIPEQSSFFKIDLKNNCRNTKKITSALSETIGQNIESHPASPIGEIVTVQSFDNKDKLVNTLKSEIADLINNHRIRPEQILLMPNTHIKQSSIYDLKIIGKYDVKALSKNGRLHKDIIHYASINLYKGLEIDVLFIIDSQLTKSSNKLYTQISRGKNKVYIYSLKV